MRTDTYGDSEPSLHQQIRALRKQQTRSEAQLALLLARFMAVKGYAELGFASIRDYADACLGLTPRMTMDYVRIGRALVELPVLRAAFEAAELGFAKVRELVRVVDADTEAEWVDYAADVTCKDLDIAVSGSKPGDFPPNLGDPPRGSPKVRLVFELDSTDAEVVKHALAELRGRAAGADVEPGLLLVEMARLAMASTASTSVEASLAAEPLATEPAGPIELVEPVDDAAGETVAELRYRVVVARCPDCQTLTHVGQFGARDVAPETAAEIACHHELVDLEHPIQPGRLTRSIAPRVERQVRHRDGYRCTVLGCTNHRFIDLHHIDHHADGGASSVDNLRSLCTAHHRMYHAGKLTL